MPLLPGTHTLPLSEQAQEDVRQQLREFEETKKQIEEDEDREIQDIKTKYEKKLRDEKESNLRLKGETGIMRKKVRAWSRRGLAWEGQYCGESVGASSGGRWAAAEAPHRRCPHLQQVGWEGSTAWCTSGCRVLTTSSKGVAVGASLLLLGIVRFTVALMDVPWAFIHWQVGVSQSFQSQIPSRNGNEVLWR